MAHLSVQSSLGVLLVIPEFFDLEFVDAGIVLISPSMVLTKAAFFHHDWMKKYWSNEAAIVEAREHVEQSESLLR
jgi:hypothetical protein